MKRNRLIICRQWVARMASIIETVVALVVLLAILVAGVRVLFEVKDLVLAPDVDEAFTTFLSSAFNVVIGIEFVKDAAKHSPGSAIDGAASLPLPARWWWSIPPRWKIW